MFTTSTMRIRPNFPENTLLKVLAGFYVCVWIAAAINPVYPADWVLENILVILFLVGIVWTYKFFPLSDLSYLLMTAFMTLHAIGAHYTYAETPVGFWMQDWFGFSRNHFDRVVHFSFGLLMAYPIREIFLRVANAKGFFAYYLPFDVTLAFSGAYEIIEMLVAILVSPDAGDAYLGTQGDVWDAQKDMGLAALGAIICMVITAMIRSSRKKPRTPDYSLE
jgi:putative membrane protein